MTRKTALTTLAVVLSACFSDPIASSTTSSSNDTSSSGDGDGDGDGDGTPGDGDGTPGDGDGTPGDGDGTPGDGDGDGTPGDGDGAPMPACLDLPSSILYDQQLDLGKMARWSAQVSEDLPFVFEPADDIPVPPGECWCVQRVVAFGSYWEDMMPPETMSRVSFYHDDPNADPPNPNNFPFFSEDSLATESVDAISVELSEPVILEAGRHWLSFMRVMNSNPGNLRWYWNASAEGIGTENFRFRAQGNTLSDCDVWQYPDICAMQDPMFENLAFQLWGVPADCP